MIHEAFRHVKRCFQNILGDVECLTASYLPGNQVDGLPGIAVIPRQYSLAANLTIDPPWKLTSKIDFYVKKFLWMRMHICLDVHDGEYLEIYGPILETKHTLEPVGCTRKPNLGSNFDFYVKTILFICIMYYYHCVYSQSRICRKIYSLSTIFSIWLLSI